MIIPLHTLLREAQQALYEDKTWLALNCITHALALMESHEPPPFDPTKPLRLVGYQFGIPLYANVDENE